MQFVYVFLGGGAGAMCRFLVSKMISENQNGFPWPTLIANCISSLILGILIGVALKQNLSGKYQLLLMTGFCGGFSTFSTFSAENFKLLEQGHFQLFLLYSLVSIIFCILLIWLGVKISN